LITFAPPFNLLTACYCAAFSEEPQKISADSFLRRSCNSGWRSASFTSALIFSVMLFGVPGGATIAYQANRLESRQRLCDDRHIGKRRQAPGEATCEQLEITGLDEGQGNTEIVEHQIDVAGEQALKRPVPTPDRG